MNKHIISFILCSAMCLQTMSGQEGSSAQSITINMESDTVSVTVQAADQAFVDGQYSRAIQMYQEIIATQGVSAGLYLNLGNAYFKTDNLAQALISYERAILLDPTDQDVRFNLELARSKCVDKTTQPNMLFITAWAKKISRIMNVNQWGMAAIVFLTVAMALICVYYILAPGRRGKGLCAWLFPIFILFSIMSWITAGQQKRNISRHDYAIVTAPSVTVRSTPSSQGTEIVIVHEGFKVKVEDKSSMKQWIEIKLEDGNVGWIETDMIEII